jgi:hypothetical protein
MPPLRFKAVCTETGREFGVDDLTVSGMMNFIDHPLGLYWSVLIANTHTHTNEPKLCQSTGLHDSQGKEVFEGDIILVYFPKTDEGYFYSVFFDRGGFKLEGFYFPDQEKPGGQRHWLGVEVLLDAIEGGATLCFVGNRWMPAEELKARAEAVSKS